MSLQENDMEALQRLEDITKKYQKEGNFLQALEYMERGLVLKQHCYGSESDIVWKACQAAGELCNLLAMTYLQQDNFELVLELLRKAEILTERDPAGRAATFNNFACYYRRMGKLHAAMQYIQKSLKIEAKLSNVKNVSDTHINACAVLSQLGRHQPALEHAQTALIFLQDELLSPGRADPPQADRIGVLAIAYHNIAVEQEFLKQTEASIASYHKGVEVAERYLGATHPITTNLTNSLIAAKKNAAKSHSKAHDSHKIDIRNKSPTKDNKAKQVVKGSSLYQVL